MLACELFKSVCTDEIKDIDITSVTYDSRKVKDGSVFVCIKGFETDGHKYAKSAVEKGAKVIVAEHMADGMEKEGLTVVIFENTRKALALMSAAYYDYPAEKMNIIGVTGTNGKTTTTYLIKTIVERLGYKSGVVGTIVIRTCHKLEDDVQEELTADIIDTLT